MAVKVYIDGEAGTTGLQIHERLAGRSDIDLMLLGDRRRDVEARREALNSADIAILCLPDDAARESASMIESDTRVIDASTAHRIAEGWTYGFAEMTAGQAEAIARADRVGNVGCYATASIALLRPLREAGALDAGAGVALNGVSGYSGGGKAMIAEMEADGAPRFFTYALDQAHKHLPEITRYGLLDRPPVFVPNVGNYAQGMIVSLPLPAGLLAREMDRDGLLDLYAAHFGSGDVVVMRETPARIDPEMHNGTNTMSIHVRGNPETGNMVALAVLDNLGKGASGSAVQCLDLMIGARSAA
ncbi:MAG: N-acetyl-gamma-glutamyl-phosphate reductase [Rubricella sp.]